MSRSKVIVMCCLMLVMIFCLSTADTVLANEEFIAVFVEDELFWDFQNPAIVVGGRTLMPIRGLFEFMRFDVTWNRTTRQVTLERYEDVVVLTIGSADFVVNGENHSLDIPAQIINGNTMIPVRAVLESLGYYVSWDGRSREISISVMPITYVTILNEQFNLARETVNLRRMGLTDQDLEILVNEIRTKLPNLTGLDLSDNYISNVAPISDLQNLQWIVLTNNQISDLEAFTNLTTLTWLDLPNNQIYDITALAHLSNLTWLNLGYNRIENIAPLANLVELQTLRLNNNKIEDMTPLANLTGLWTIDLSGNRISYITPMAKSKRLWNLNLSNNQISDLTPLAELYVEGSLFYLNLSNNQIDDITPLAELSVMRLNLSNNQISDLTQLESSWFSILDLSNNPITDWSPVRYISGVIGRPEAQQEIEVFYDGDETQIQVYVHGNLVYFDDQQPIIVNNRTLIPIRGVFETLGFTVNWDANAQQVTLTNDDNVIIITIGSAEFTTNGVRHITDVPAQILGGRTMIPIRSVLESVGYHLHWNDTTMTVFISSVCAREVLAKSAEIMRNVGDHDTVQEQIVKGYDSWSNETMFMQTLAEISVLREPFKVGTTVTMESKIDGEFFEMSMRAYMVHEDEYIVTYAFSEFFNTWTKETIPFCQEYIDIQLQLNSLQLIYDFMIDAGIAGEEIINGVMCWKIEITLNHYGLIEVIDSLSENPMIGSSYFLLRNLGDMRIVTVWIAQEDFFMARIDIDATEIMNRVMGFGDSEIFKWVISRSFFNFDNATPFILPEELQDAIDLRTMSPWFL